MPPLPDLERADGDARDVLDAYFAEHSPSPEAVSEYVLKLHDAGRHEHVIAAVESALVNGQGQPWMYEVLALSMTIAKRPQDEIERVLLSRVDFSAADVPSMLYSAAYLTRFGARLQALRLYRQASQLQPTRPEPYALGLKLAREQQDYDAIRWAAAGILTNVWTRDHAELHRQAENAALEAEQALRKAGRDEEAEALAAAIREARVHDLVLRLRWSGEGDLDLIIEEPAGTVCSHENPQTAGGGVLVHDGYGPDPKNCFEEYICAKGAPGTYRVRVKHAWGNIVGKRAMLTIVRYRGTSHESQQSVPVTLSEDGTVVRLSLAQGRRTELAPVPTRESNDVGQSRRSRRTLVQMMGGVDVGSRVVGAAFEENRRRRQLLGLQTGPAGTVTYQPVISVLSEGVTMSALAVVSGDRRYVRISTAPAFTALTDVFTFTFAGGNPGNGTGGNGAGTP